MKANNALQYNRGFIVTAMWTWLVVLAGVTSATAVELTPDEVTSTEVTPLDTGNDCLNLNLNQCPGIQESCPCLSLANFSAIICCHIRDSFQLKRGLQCAVRRENYQTIRHLHVYNASLENLKGFEYLDLYSLSVTDSRVEDPSPLPLNLLCLNLSASGIPDTVPGRIRQVVHLTTLDLSMNNLTKLPELDNVYTLDISGNQVLGCQALMQFLKDHPNVSFLNEDNTFCLSSTNFTWFESVDQVKLSQMKNLLNVEQSCPVGCSCKNHRQVMVAGKDPIFALSVNCSAMGLQKLPDDLPPNTVLLNVSFNNITSLDGLIENKMYENIQEFYADSNQISSILALEGSKFIDDFRTLSLRENNIKSLPTYILSNMFDRNNNERRVNLGGNRLTCNCSVAQVVKMWLLSNRKHVPDYDQVLCDNPGEKIVQKVIELDQNKVCIYPRDWTDYIYYIIAGEVGLLFLLVGKVSYDYWVFKTAGYLPWPASKMPKLPCDWVFE